MLLLQGNQTTTMKEFCQFAKPHHHIFKVQECIEHNGAAFSKKL
jgi:hypothetical protein